MKEEKKNSRKSKVSTVIYIVLLVAVVGAWYSYTRYKSSQESTSIVMTDTETEKQLQANQAYLQKVQTEDSTIQALPAGVLYKVIKEGNGQKPTPTSTVTVNYEGRTTDGHVFDSSYKRGQPATFRLDQVIKGWTVAVCSMPVGSTWEIYVPSDLAYGSAGTNGIAPNSVLIFKIELISVN